MQAAADAAYRGAQRPAGRRGAVHTGDGVAIAQGGHQALDPFVVHCTLTGASVNLQSIIIADYFDVSD
jgi:hypothetical protein